MDEGTIVYCATRRQAEEVAEFLQAKGIDAYYFAGAMRCVRDDPRLRVALVNPDRGNHSPRQLADTATFVKRLWNCHLRRSLLPDTLTDEVGLITRPEGW